MRSAQRRVVRFGRLERGELNEKETLAKETSPFYFNYGKWKIEVLLGTMTCRLLGGIVIDRSCRG